MDGAELLRRFGRMWRGQRTPSASELDALMDEVLAQPDGEAVLIQAIEAAKSPFTRSALLARLGGAEGPDGVAVLRSYADATGPGSRDVRGNALGGLSKRLGVAATQDLRAALHHADSDTRMSAMFELIQVGDDSAWEDAFDVWSRWVKRGRSLWDDPDCSVAGQLLYLLRGVEPGDGRAVRLVTVIRSRTPVIDERWYQRFWPDALPGGPTADEVPLPDYERLVCWWLLTRYRYFAPPGRSLVFRVQCSEKRERHAPMAIGELLAGGADVHQDERKRAVAIDGRRLRAYVGVAEATVANLRYHLLALPYSYDVELAAGSLVEVLDED